MRFNVLPPFDQHNRPMIPPTEEDYFTYRPLGQLCKITTRSGKFERKFAHFHLKRRSNCVQLLFLKIKILLDQGFP